LVCDAEGNIYFGSSEGNYFYALNKTGELLWKVPLNGYEYYSSPAIGSDGTLYIGTSLSTFFQHHVDNLIAVNNKPNSVEEEEKKIDFRLEQNYPNPFNPVTKIKFSTPIANNIKLIVYDILGKEITTLLNEYKQPGEYEINFDAKGLPSGVYYYVMTTGEYSIAKKLIIVK
jgi:outer membrane protein assembly factor BamB